MAKYYNIGNTFDNIRLALLDYYGAYDASTNPTGVDIKEYSVTLLIFTCTAISDKVIKFTYASSDLFALYGDAYSGSGVITNEVSFAGTTTAGATSASHMVCADNTLLINAFVTSLNSKLIVVGKLTDDSYAVLGLVGYSSYGPGFSGFLTASNTQFWVYGLEGSFSVGAKRLKMPLVLVTEQGAVNNGSNLVTFRDLYSVSNALGFATVYKGTGYFVTTSAMYAANGSVIANSMIITGVTN